MSTAITTRTGQRLSGLLLGLVILGLLVAACGGTTTGTSAPAPSGQAPSSASQGGGGTATAGQYLVKSLEVNMMVKDTRQVATDLQMWISTTDPSSSSAGIDYEQTDNNLYTVSMKFAVRASLYTQIKLYLADYPAQHKGQLLSLHETIQDVTNDYVDTQSRLKNLRVEQQRLLTLLSSATAIGDVIAIEQRLTEVEGQIESIQAHLNALNGQVTFYTVAINLQPISTPTSATFDVLKTLQGAWAATLVFGQVLITLVIWLLTFSIYIVPVVLVVLFLRRRRRARLAAAGLQGRPMVPVVPTGPVGPPQTGP